eukprot:gene51840-48757_t
MAPTPMMRVCAELIGSVSARGGVPADAAVTVYDAEEPTPIAFCDYFARWAQYTETDDSLAVCAIIYVDRFCTRTKIAVNACNAHRILLAALLMATKCREDQ